jgi:hypothetical protein
VEFLSNVGIKSSITIFIFGGESMGKSIIFMEQYIGKVRLGCQMSKTKKEDHRKTIFDLSNIFCSPLL